MPRKMNQAVTLQELQAGGGVDTQSALSTPPKARRLWVHGDAVPLLQVQNRWVSLG